MLIPPLCCASRGGTWPLSRLLTLKPPRIVYFKTNCRLIREREHTYGWLRELYQMPIGNSVNMAHIKNQCARVRKQSPLH